MAKHLQDFVLGVDIGTGSVAWAAYSLTSKGEFERLAGSGVYIFGEPVAKSGKGELSLKSEQKRRARLLRRQIERKRARINKLMRLFDKAGVDHTHLAAALGTQARPHELWALRAKAVSEKVGLTELFLVLLRMAKNRGYAGVKPSPKTGNKELGRVGKGLEATEQLMALAPQAQTVAQALVATQATTNPSQRRFKKLTELGTYVLRSQIEQEFDLLMAEQKKHHPVLSKTVEDLWGSDFLARLKRDQYVADGKGSHEFWGYVPTDFADALRHTIFYQRPLKSFKDKIGSCSSGSGELRVVAAHPAHQTFRLEKLLNDLGWGDPKSATPLTAEQKQVVRAELAYRETRSFGEIYKAMKKAGCAPEEGLALNFHTPRRDHLKGRSTFMQLKKRGLVEAFEALTSDQQGYVFEALGNDINAPEAWGYENNSARAEVIAQYGQAVAEFIDQLAASDGGLDRLKAMGFDGGRVAYGASALRTLTAYMAEHQCDEHEARKVLYPTSATSTTRTGELPSVESLQLRSPVVTHALEHTRRELMRVIKRFGLPKRMVIELSKPVKSTLEERDETEKRQRYEERDNAEARAEIQRAGLAVTNTSITKYKLWQQQAKRCPYSGDAIQSIEQALDGSRCEIEHIVPKRLHGVGNRFHEIVLATRQFNALKAADETPYLASQRLGVRWDWAKTEQAVARIKSETQDKRGWARKAQIILDQTRFRADGLNDDDFVDRQLQETQWIGREVNRWCRSLCDDVTVVRGGLTADLRHAWGLDEVLLKVRVAEGRHSRPKAQELFFKPTRAGEMRFDKRSDHRQHLIDACVIGLSTRANYLAMVRARQARAAGRKAEFRAPDCPVSGLYAHLEKLLMGYQVWHKPDRLVSGQFFKQEPLGLSKDGVTLLKKGKTVNQKFNPGVDKLISRTDRHGRTHRKALLKDDTACMVVTKDGFSTVNIADFRSRFVVDNKLKSAPDERLFFKNDLVALPGEPTIYRVAQLKARGICLVSANESRTFDELDATGLTKMLSSIKEIPKVRVVKHPIELAEVVRSLKAQSQDAK